MKKRLPMPIETLFEHPAAIAMPSAAYGMLARLCHHFWATDCRPMPKSDDELKAIARAHRPTWNTHRPDVMTVFEAWKPIAEAYWQYRQDKRGIIDKVIEKANGARRAQATRQREAGSQLIPPAHDVVSQPMRRADKRAEAVGARQERADGFVDPL